MAARTALVSLELTLLIFALTPVLACDRDRDPERRPGLASQTREAGTIGDPRTRSAGAPGEPRARGTSATRGDLDALAIEIAATSACERLRGQLRALGARDRRISTGTVWLRDCMSGIAGNQVTFVVAGQAWQRTDDDEPVVVRFSVRMSGRLSVDYQPDTHMLQIRFEPVLPVVHSTYPLRSGGRAGESIAAAIEEALAVALVTPGHAPTLSPVGVDLEDTWLTSVSLCNPIPVLALGSQTIAGLGDAPVPVELTAAAPALFGPMSAAQGMQLNVRTVRGAVDVSVLCHREATSVAQAYAEARPVPDVRSLETRRVRRPQSLQLVVPPTTCPVAVMLRAVDRETALVHWSRRLAASDLAVAPVMVRCALPGVEPVLEDVP